MEKANRTLEKALEDELVPFAFGRHFIPSLNVPFRLENSITLTRYSFYTAESPDVHIDYASANLETEGLIGSFIVELYILLV